MTGLANRLGLAEYLDQALREADAKASRVVVGVLDLDDFKHVNDTWGHEAGDQLLRQVADRLRQAVGPDNLAARLGGDEFVVVVTDAGDESAVDTRWAAIQKAFEAVKFPDGSVRQMGLSIGLTRYPDDAGDPDGLLRHADIALYQVKSQKSRRSVWWQWWTPGQDG